MKNNNFVSPIKESVLFRQPPCNLNIFEGFDKDQSFTLSNPFNCADHNVLQILNSEKVLPKGPTKILPFLYVGSYEDSNNEALLQELGITHVLNISNSCSTPTFVSRNYSDALVPTSKRYTYLRIPIDDLHNVNMLPWVDVSYEFIENARINQKIVLAHCLAGISRSPSFAVAYVMRHLRMNFERAYKFVKIQRPAISPNFNFLGQLLEYERTLSSTPYSPRLTKRELSRDVLYKSPSSPSRSPTTATTFDRSDDICYKTNKNKLNKLNNSLSFNVTPSASPQPVKEAHQISKSGINDMTSASLTPRRPTCLNLAISGNDGLGMSFGQNKFSATLNDNTIDDNNNFKSINKRRPCTLNFSTSANGINVPNNRFNKTSVVKTCTNLTPKAETPLTNSRPFSPLGLPELSVKKLCTEKFKFSIQTTRTPDSSLKQHTLSPSEVVSSFSPSTMLAGLTFTDTLNHSKFPIITPEKSLPQTPDLFTSMTRPSLEKIKVALREGDKLSSVTKPHITLNGVKRPSILPISSQISELSQLSARKGPDKSHETNSLSKFYVPYSPPEIQRDYLSIDSPSSLMILCDEGDEDEVLAETLPTLRSVPKETRSDRFKDSTALKFLKFFVKTRQVFQRKSVSSDLNAARSLKFTERWPSKSCTKQLRLKRRNNSQALEAMIKEPFKFQSSQGSDFNDTSHDQEPKHSKSNVYQSMKIHDEKYGNYEKEGNKGLVNEYVKISFISANQPPAPLH